MRIVPRSVTVLTAIVGCFLVAGCAERPQPAERNADRPEVPVPADAGDETDNGGSAPESENAPTGSQAKLPAPKLLPREKFEDGWIQLFDGQTLFGWKANNDVNWSVEQGVIQADQGDPGLLLTTVPFADYELRCDYRLEKGGNSGVFLRTVFKPEDPAKDCYELNMADSHPKYPTGSLVGREAVGQNIKGEGEWKTWHVTVEGPTIVARLDGKTILDFTDTSEHVRKSGLIGLQKNEGRIEFRNISLRPLGTKPIFNGKDLSGWHEVPGSKSEFAAADGTIHVKGGPGFLETDETWGDFILQADAKTNDARINSGIFFRTMKGTEQAPSNGYELQIHNGFKQGDRSQPDDYGTGFGTGAIFRFARARRVVPDDNEWFTLTLVAHGPRVASWVNGYQVTDWTDTRQPDENPRRGRRLDAGHIILQGHDPGTDIQFRELKVGEHPEE